MTSSGNETLLGINASSAGPSVTDEAVGQLSRPSSLAQTNPPALRTALEIWEAALSSLVRSMAGQTGTAYLHSLALVGRFSSAASDEAGSTPASAATEDQSWTEKWTLAAPSKLVAKQVEERFSRKLVAALAQEGSRMPTVTITVDPAAVLTDRSGTFSSTATVSPLVLHKIAPRFIKGSLAQPSTSVPTSGSMHSIGSDGSSSKTAPSLNGYPAQRSGSSSALLNASSSTGQSSSGSGLPEAILNPRYTFDTFVVGSGSQFCHAAAQRVAERPGENYNPLFIYGPVGLGKTHLLHAIGNELRKRNPEARILYTSSEGFTNELINALRLNRMNELKSRLRGLDLLLIDDIQFMSGKDRTQEEFFHTFNTLYNAKKQIVITSDKSPQEIIGLEERLQTRFSWGLTADLQAPDFETRFAIVKQKCIADGSPIPDPIVKIIAEGISSNVRELEGALNRILAAVSLQGKPLSAELAHSLIRPFVSPKQVNISADLIKKVVCEFYGIKVSEMISKRRTRNLAFPRHIAMYLCRKHTTLSYPEIGAAFGGRDHSSVIHAASVVAEKVKGDAGFKASIADLERGILRD